jgi:hypothetical protein
MPLATMAHEHMHMHKCTHDVALRVCLAITRQRDAARTAPHRCKDGVVGVASERRRARQQHVRDDADAPHVARLRVLATLGGHLHTPCDNDTCDNGRVICRLVQRAERCTRTSGAM